MRLEECSYRIWISWPVAFALLTSIAAPGRAQSPAWNLAGQVIDARTHGPVVRALVRFADRAALTDHEGRFAFSELEQDGDVTVIKPGFYSATELFGQGERHVGQNSGAITLLLYPEAVLSGTFTTPSGDPLAGVRVSALRRINLDDRMSWNNTAEIVTDSRGRFRMAVPPGEYRLKTPYAAVSPETPTMMSMPIELPGEGEAALHVGSGEVRQFDLRPSVLSTHLVTVRVEGTLNGATPMITAISSTSGAVLQLHPEPCQMPGSFDVRMPDGTWKLRLVSNTQYADTTVNVFDKAVAVVVRFVPWSSVRLQMSADPTAGPTDKVPTIVELGLMLESLDSHPLAGMDFRPVLRPDQTEIFSLPPGRYRLIALANAWFMERAQCGNIDLLRSDLTVGSEGETLNIKVIIGNRVGKLHGAARLGNAVRQLWVYALPDEAGFPPVFSIKSDADGRFSLTNLPEGGYQLVAFENRHPVDFRDADVLDGMKAHARLVMVQAGADVAVELDAIPASEEALP